MDCIYIALFYLTGQSALQCCFSFTHSHTHFFFISFTSLNSLVLFAKSSYISANFSPTCHYSSWPLLYVTLLPSVGLSSEVVDMNSHQTSHSWSTHRCFHLICLIRLFVRTVETELDWLPMLLRPFEWEKLHPITLIGSWSLATLCNSSTDPANLNLSK